MESSVPPGSVSYSRVPVLPVTPSGSLTYRQDWELEEETLVYRSQESHRVTQKLSREGERHRRPVSGGGLDESFLE